MSELPPVNEFESGLIANRAQIVERLVELGIDVTAEDVNDLDDNELLGVVATYADSHGYDIEEVLIAVAEVEVVAHDEVDLEHVVQVLKSNGVEGIEADLLVAMDMDALQRTVVWLLKEQQLNYERIGKECFGNAWKEGVWQ